MSRLPAPGEWHPAYADTTHTKWLAAWLGGEPDLDVVQVPYIQNLHLPPDEELDSSTWAFHTHTLTRRKCWGAAPYVGEPYVYVWTVAVDELGRVIAGEAKRQPTGA